MRVDIEGSFLDWSSRKEMVCLREEDVLIFEHVTDSIGLVRPKKGQVIGNKEPCKNRVFLFPHPKCDFRKLMKMISAVTGLVAEEIQGGVRTEYVVCAPAFRFFRKK